MSKTSLVHGTVNELPLFDLRPMEMGGFSLRGRSVIPVGRPSLDGWVQAMRIAVASHESSPYWIADLMAYGESRKEWADKLDQAIALTGLARSTLLNLGYLARHVAEVERQIAPSVSHAMAVSRLPVAEQRQILTEARERGWNLSETRREVKAQSRRKVLEGQASLEGQYRVIYADCPWLYGNKPPSGSGAQSHYAGMTIEQLCALPIAAHARPHSVLFFWVTSPLLMQNPGPRDVLDAWGFTYKASCVWDKVEHGFGNYVSIRHELVLIATRGKCLPDRPTPLFDSVLTERQVGEHSAKPESVRTMIERLYDGPYLELFAREHHTGWTSFGDDARLWAPTG